MTLSILYWINQLVISLCAAKNIECSCVTKRTVENVCFVVLILTRSTTIQAARPHAGVAANLACIKKDFAIPAGIIAKARAVANTLFHGRDYCMMQLDLGK